MIGLDYCPKLRWPLDVQNVNIQNISCLVLRDPFGLAERVAAVPAELGPLLSLFDGSRSIRSILVEHASWGLTETLLCGIVRGLKELRYLDDAETQQVFDELRKNYNKESLRPPALAGRGYPDDPVRLTKLIEQFLHEAACPAVEAEAQGRIKAIVSPHIDYARGWQAYAAAYRALEAAALPDIVFIFGTAHAGGSTPFHLARKDFALPTGVLRCACDVVDAVAQRYGEGDSFRDELLHRQEHSIELQLPFLLHRFAAEKLPHIVPVLVGSFHHFVQARVQPVDDERVGAFVWAAAQTILDAAASHRRVLLIASVDLAHTGRHFGDIQQTTDEDLRIIAGRDKELLALLCRSDEAGLISHIMDDQDRRRVCGYPALYTMLAIMKCAGWTPEGKVLDYRQAIDKE
ncbi:MAG TPA: AmmeMemoRadiSam system protein B, partial [Oligoflexia bacterium]|nr:AmmeMemoRadiSam system protein B [Oligoflexia bacterium]